ncbi:hypothetical protein Efla_006167 [Eimeria flavescens]
MLLLRRWGLPRHAAGSAVIKGRRGSLRPFSGSRGPQAQQGPRGRGGAPRRNPSFRGPSRNHEGVGEGGGGSTSGLAGDAFRRGPRGPPKPIATGGPPHPPDRFPRPDLDVEALREEQRKVQEASQWRVVTAKRDSSEGLPYWVRPEGSPAGLLRASDASSSLAREGEALQLSAGAQQERLLGDGGTQRPQPACIYDVGLTSDSLAGSLSSKGSSGGPPQTLFSEGPTDWRLQITEEFDAEWARLSGGPWDEDSRGPPWGANDDRLKDKRLKVFVPQLGGPKPVALLNRFQLLGVLENPAEALGQPAEGGPQAPPLRITLPLEVCEALVERLLLILPSFDRQQLQKLAKLQQQHVHALQQQHSLLLQRRRAMRLRAAAAAGAQEQQVQQRAAAEAVEAEAAAEAVKAESAAAAAARSLKALQQQQLLDRLFDELLPHLPHMSLEELGGLARTFAVSTGRKGGGGYLQVLALHAVDRLCSAQWLLPIEAPQPQQRGGLVGGLLAFLQPLLLGSLRAAAAGAPRCHRALGGPRLTQRDIEGPLAGTAEGPPEFGGALGFACRRLLEPLCEDSALRELQSLSRGHLLQLLVCCCAAGSGISSASYTVARRCVELLLGASLLQSACEGGARATASLELKEAPPLTLEEALTLLICCSYLEVRGGPPHWQLPLFTELLGAPHPFTEGLGGETGGPSALCIRGRGDILGPPLLLRCSPPTQLARGPSTSVLSPQQLQPVLKALERALPLRGSLEEALASSLLLHTGRQQHPQGPSSAGGPRLLDGRTSEADDGLLGPPEEWAVRVEVRSPERAPSGAPFHYLDEEEGPPTHLQQAAIPAAVVLAATEAIGWALSRLLQEQQRQQGGGVEEQQQQRQQHDLHESIVGASGLLAMLASLLVSSARGLCVSFSALLQGAHALADAAENLLGAVEGPYEEAMLQLQGAPRLAALALLGSEASLLRLAASRGLQLESSSGGSVSSKLAAVCCCIQRSLQVLKAPGALGPPMLEGPQAQARPGETERAAAAAFISTAADSLRSVRLALGGKGEEQSSTNKKLRGLPLSLQAQWLKTLGALLQRSQEQQRLTGEAAAAALNQVSEVSDEGAPLAPANPVADEVACGALTAGDSGESLQSEEAPQTALRALEAFLACVQPLMPTSPQSWADEGAAAATTPGTAAEAANGLECLLKQLRRLAPLLSKRELRAAADVSQHLLRLQQEAARKRTPTEAPSPLGAGPRAALSDAIGALDTSLLEQLSLGRNGRGPLRAPPTYPTKETLPGRKKQGGP